MNQRLSYLLQTLPIPQNRRSPEQLDKGPRPDTKRFSLWDEMEELECEVSTEVQILFTTPFVEVFLPLLAPVF